MAKTTSPGLKKMHEYAKAQVSPKKKIEWYRKRHIEMEADIRLLKSRLELANSKILFLEDKYWESHNVRPTYQDLALRVREILGKRKKRRKENEKQRA